MDYSEYRQLCYVLYVQVGVDIFYILGNLKRCVFICVCVGGGGACVCNAQQILTTTMSVI